MNVIRARALAATLCVEVALYGAVDSVVAPQPRFFPQYLYCEGLSMHQTESRPECGSMIIFGPFGVEQGAVSDRPTFALQAIVDNFEEPISTRNIEDPCLPDTYSPLVVENLNGAGFQLPVSLSGGLVTGIYQTCATVAATGLFESAFVITGNGVHWLPREAIGFLNRNSPVSTPSEVAGIQIRVSLNLLVGTAHPERRVTF